MAVKPKALFIPLDKGLDTYSNPHLLRAGAATAASGVTLDRPGYVYPGPSLLGVAVGAFNYNTAYERYGLVSYISAQPTPRDVLLTWASYTGGLAIFPSTGQLQDAVKNRIVGFVWPVTSSVRRVYDPYYRVQGFAGIDMVGPPVTCLGTGPTGQVQYFAYVASGGTTPFAVVIATDPSTGSVLALRSQPAPDGTSNIYQIQLVSDGAGNVYLIEKKSGPITITQLALGTLTAGNVTINPLVTRTIAGASLLDAVSARAGATAAEPAYIVGYDGTSTVIYTLLNGTLSASFAPFGATAAPTGATVWLDDTSISAVLPTPNVYVAAAFSGASATLSVAQLPNTATSVIQSGTSTLFTGTNSIPRLTGLSSSSTAISVALEIVGNPYTIGIVTTPPSAVSIQYNQVTIVGLNAPFTTANLQANFTHQGGAGLIGKMAKYVAASLAQPLNTVNDLCVPVRTGWLLDGSNVGSGRAQAAPTGYMLDSYCRVVASWGAIALGTPTTYASPYQLSASVRLAGGTNVDHVTSWPWPELTTFNSVTNSGLTNGTPTDAHTAVSTFSLTRAKTVPNIARQLGNTSIVAGGLTSYFDGQYVAESGFLSPPAPPILQSVPAPSPLPAGTYYYVSVLAYYDASGRKHYSQPSPPVPVTISGSNAVTIYQLYDSVSSKGSFLGQNQQLVFEFYRTTVNPGATNAQSIKYYKVSEANNSGTLANQTSITGQTLGPLPSTAIFTSISDSTPDVVLSTGRVLYTYGQTLLAATTVQAPPSFSSLTVWQNCLWGLAQRTQPELWLSWPNDTALPTPEAPAWSLANRVVLPSDIGDPLAIVGLDGNLLIFGTNADYALTGTPPGRNQTLLDVPGQLSAPTQLPTPGGLKLRNAITKLPTGILFQGTQGFTLLDRSLSYQPVGVPVRNFTNTGLYGPGVLFPEQGCVILPPADGVSPPLTYYYFENKWSSPAYDGSAPGRLQWAALTGAVRSRFTSNVPQVVAFEPDVTKPSVNVLSPGGGYLQVRTPWIEMEQSSVVGSDIASVAGYGELWEVQVQGDLLTPLSHTITLQTEYDYAGNTQTPPDVQTITNTLPNVAASTAPSAGDWQWRYGFRTTQARRVRFTLTFQVTDLANLVPGDPVVLISGLMLHYGVDDGLSRMGASGSSGYGGT